VVVAATEIKQSALMAEVACEHSDKVILTSTIPANEKLKIF
jgi:hypothetical protein